jgi:hypothetical protein
MASNVARPRAATKNMQVGRDIGHSQSIPVIGRSSTRTTGRISVRWPVSHDSHGSKPVTNMSPKPSSSLQNRAKHGIRGIG